MEQNGNTRETQDAGTTNHSNDIYSRYQLEYLRAPLFGSVTLPSPGITFIKFLPRWAFDAVAFT